MIDLSIEDCTVECEWSATLSLMDYYEKEYFLEAQTDAKKENGLFEKLLNALRRLLQILKNNFSKVKDKTIKSIQKKDALKLLKQKVNSMSERERQAMINTFESGKLNAKSTTQESFHYQESDDSNYEWIPHTISNVTKKVYHKQADRYGKISGAHEDLEKSIDNISMTPGEYMMFVPSAGSVVFPLLTFYGFSQGSIETIALNMLATTACIVLNSIGFRVIKYNKESAYAKLPKFKDVIKTCNTLEEHGKNINNLFGKITKYLATDHNDKSFLDGPYPDGANQWFTGILSEAMPGAQTNAIRGMVGFMDKLKENHLLDKNKLKQQDKLTENQIALIKQLSDFRYRFDVVTYDNAIKDLDVICDKIRTIADDKNFFEKHHVSEALGHVVKSRSFSETKHYKPEELKRLVFEKIKDYVMVCSTYVKTSSTLLQYSDDCIKIALIAVNQYTK